MKKLIALISAIAVMGSMSLTSLAAIEVTPNAAATGAALAKNATSGYDASYTSDKVNTQTTILAVKGAEITTSSIQYINQLAQDSETAINFDLKDALAVGETVNVYMGGDVIDKTLVGTIANVADPVVKYTVQFFNEDGISVLGTISEVESGYALAANAPAVPPKAADSEYTYEFAGWAVKGDSTLTVVTLPETVTENKEYIAVFTKTPVQSGGETTSVTISYQMVKVDITSSATDATVSTATLNSGDVIYTSLTEPTLSGYAFVGWYTDEALATKLDKTATATEATTVYAKMVKTYKYGDVNADSRGLVNASDYKALKAHITKTTVSDIIGTVIPGTSKKMGDVNADSRGLVNASDYKALKAHITKTTISDIIGTVIETVKD